MTITKMTIIITVMIM